MWDDLTNTAGIRRMTVLDDPDEREGGVATGEDPGRSPLSRELDPQSEVTDLLNDYNDNFDAQHMEQDPEIAAAVASILEPEDIEMWDAEITPGTGFNPELM